MASDFFEKVRSSDEATKKRWVIGSSAVVMGVVVLLWIVYFNAFVTGFAPSPAPENNNKEGGGFSFLTALRSGAALVGDTVIGGAKTIWHLVAKPQTYVITPNN